jgi:hypothetical protein
MITSLEKMSYPYPWWRIEFFLEWEIWFVDAIDQYPYP